MAAKYKYRPESRDKFVEADGKGLRFYDEDGNLMEILGEDPEVTERRMARLGLEPDGRRK